MTDVILSIELSIRELVHYLLWHYVIDFVGKEDCLFTDHFKFWEVSVIMVQINLFWNQVVLGILILIFVCDSLIIVAWILYHFPFIFAGYRFKWSQKTRNLWERKLNFLSQNLSFKFLAILSERRPGSIDVHPNIDAIVLNYDIDVQILGTKENFIHGEKKVCMLVEFWFDLIKCNQFISFLEP